MAISEQSANTSIAPGRAEVELERPTVGQMVREAWVWRSLIPRIGIRVTIKGISGTYLGRAWLVLRPALMVFGMAFLFGRVLNAPSQGVPYLVFLFIGFGAWMAFERSIFWAVRSFDVYRRLVRNMYLPLVLIPVSAGIPAFIEFSVIGLFTAGTLAYFAMADGQLYLQLGPQTLLGATGYLLAYLTAISLGMWLAVLNAYARDVRITFVFILRIWLYVTPVIYPLTALPSGLQTVAELNPVVAPVLLVKWGLLGVGGVPLHSFVATAVWIVVVGGSGLWFLTNRAPTVLSRQPPGMGDDEDEQ